MPVSLINLAELLENLPADTGQRSTEPHNSGFCWFKSPEGHPDQTHIEKHIEAADLPEGGESAGNELEEALAAGFLSMNIHDEDAGEAGLAEESFRALLFWRGGITDSAIPCKKTIKEEGQPCLPKKSV